MDLAERAARLEHMLRVELLEAPGSSGATTQHHQDAGGAFTIGENGTAQPPAATLVMEMAL